MPVGSLDVIIQAFLFSPVERGEEHIPQFSWPVKIFGAKQLSWSSLYSWGLDLLTDFREGIGVSF